MRALEKFKDKFDSLNDAMKYFALLRQFVADFFDSLSIFIDICSV